MFVTVHECVENAIMTSLRVEYGVFCSFSGVNLLTAQDLILTKCLIVLESVNKFQF